MAKPKLRPPPPRGVLVPPTVGKEGTPYVGPPLGKTRADFREEEFTKAIHQHGKYVLWRKAMLCPCLNAESQSPAMSCDHCGGAGFVFVDPVDVRAIMMSFDKRTTIFERYGIWQEGSVQVTVEPQYRLGFRDSIEMRDAVIPFTELLVKGDRRGRRRLLPSGVDAARFRIVHVAKALYQDKAKKLHVLEEGADFEVTKEGWLRWLKAGARVPDGALVSLHYDLHPVYLVLSWSHVTRDDVSGRKSAKEPKVISLPISGMAKLLWTIDSAREIMPSMEEIVPLPAGFPLKQG